MVLRRLDDHRNACGRRPPRISSNTSHAIVRGTQAQGYVTLGMEGLRGRTFVLADLLSDVSYKREGDGLATSGLYLDVPAWGHYVFELRPG